jgi:hypothetical protein
MAKKNLQIRNSTAEFLIFTSQAGENTIEVMVQDETVWLTQKMIAALFEVEVNTINYHLKEIYKSGELQEAATIRNFRIVQTEGKREVKHDVEFAKAFAESEFEKYRIVQDKLFESDFDKAVKKLNLPSKKK